jgi:hypothetical protein
MMRVFKKLVKLAGHLVVLLAFLSGFVIGAIFGETVINKFGQPTAITFFLAGQPLTSSQSN